VSELELLQMIGLDGYMMIRYLNICMRLSLFLSFFGLVVLVPVYATANYRPSPHFTLKNDTSRSLHHQFPPSPFSFTTDWNQYTLSNIPPNNADRSTTNQLLWVPVVFSYIFAAYFCYLMHKEYSNFMVKRLAYLKDGDDDTPTQTCHTVMVEQLPAQLRSASCLFDFFNKLFPGILNFCLHSYFRVPLS
jgi:hypothetical protein